MKEITVSTFDELKGQVDKVSGKYGRHSSSGYSIKNSVLFRGQTNHEWKLESTLERASKRQWTLKRYLQLAGRIRPIIESYYPLPFSELPESDIDEWFRYVAAEHGMINIPTYDYLLYLRHHGFPSPFVDWTTSLY
ncbi:MAG TPA: FRG domain-containing protein, partial [Pyrinomonadaceae bacterium]|nr:FRG domain-containing protein [Pyrinomonadaceae bacterium]